MSKKTRKTYFSIGPVGGDKGGSFVFRDVVLPSGETTRVMSRRVYEGALNSADKKLDEIVRERRKKEAAA